MGQYFGKIRTVSFLCHPVNRITGLARPRVCPSVHFLLRTGFYVKNKNMVKPNLCERFLEQNLVAVDPRSPDVK